MNGGVPLDGISETEVRLECLRLAVQHASTPHVAGDVDPVALAHAFASFVTGSPQDDGVCLSPDQEKRVRAIVADFIGSVTTRRSAR